MINFACWKCGETVSVADDEAGRLADCRACGASCSVPSAGAAPTSGRGRSEAFGQPVEAADPISDLPDEIDAPARRPNEIGPAPGPERPKRSTAPFIVGLIAILVLAIAGGGFAVWWFWPQQNRLISELKYLPDDCLEIQSHRPDKVRSSNHYQRITEALKKNGRWKDDGQHVFGIPESEIVRVIRIPAGPKESKFGGMTIVTVKKDWTPDDYKKVGHQGKEWHEEHVGKSTIYYHDAGTFCVPEPRIVLFASRDNLRTILERHSEPKFSSTLADLIKRADFGRAETGVVVHRPGGYGLLSAVGSAGTKDLEGMVFHSDVADNVSVKNIGFYKDAAAAQLALTELEQAWEKLKAASDQYRRLAKRNNIRLSLSGNTVTMTATTRTDDVIEDINKTEEKRK